MNPLRRSLAATLAKPRSLPIATNIRVMSSDAKPHEGFPSPQLPESLSSLSPAPKPKIHLYTAPTPNGFKASFVLEELILAYPDNRDIHYDFYNLSFSNNDQKSPEFLKINPNGRIPGLVDDNHGGHAVFETASIMIWLVEVSHIVNTID